MISASHFNDARARADDSLVVRYSGQYPGFYIARTLPFFAVFALLAVLYLDEDSRRWIFSRNTATHKPFSWFEFGFLLALAIGALSDLVLTVTRVRQGAVALSVSPDGITGPIFHRTRLLSWDEIADVAVDGRFLVIRRRPQSVVQNLFARRSLGDIHVPVDHLDRDADDILAAVRRVKPAEHQHTAAL